MNNLAKNSALARIQSLLDEGSFVEMGACVKARSTDFHLDKEDTPADGVITGYGLANGRLVYIYSQNASVLGGAIGEMHSKKITQLYDMAMKMGAPIIGIIDCAGLRLAEAGDALNGLGSIYLKQVMASGLIPQFTLVMGSCGGGISLIPALSDFTFVESKKGSLFLQSPDAIPGNTRDKCNTSDTDWRASNTNNIDFIGTEEEIYEEVLLLLDILPSNNRFDILSEEGSDELNRLCDGIADLSKDAASVLSLLGDHQQFIETKKLYAREMTTGFIRLNDMVVGCVANRSLSGEEVMTSALTAAGAKKAASFIKYCDAFHIPVLTLCNVSGFDSSFEAESTFGDSCAAMITAYASATVPTVTIVLDEAMGSAGTAMGSKSLGVDLLYAWENAKIGPMDSLQAARILHEGEPASIVRQKAEEYEKLQNSAVSAAARGYADAIIMPEQTRKYLISAFEMLATKQDHTLIKKHTSV